MARSFRLLFFVMTLALAMAGDSHGQSSGNNRNYRDNKGSAARSYGNQQTNRQGDSYSSGSYDSAYDEDSYGSSQSQYDSYDSGKRKHTGQMIKEKAAEAIGDVLGNAIRSVGGVGGSVQMDSSNMSSQDDAPVPGSGMQTGAPSRMQDEGSGMPRPAGRTKKAITDMK